MDLLESDSFSCEAFAGRGRTHPGSTTYLHCSTHLLLNALTSASGPGAWWEEVTVITDIREAGSQESWQPLLGVSFCPACGLLNLAYRPVFVPLAGQLSSCHINTPGATCLDKCHGSLGGLYTPEAAPLVSPSL